MREVSVKGRCVKSKEGSTRLGEQHGIWCSAVKSAV